MTAYKFFQDGPGVPHAHPSAPPFFKKLDVPDLIANAKLAVVSAPTVAVKLASTGFAQNDTLELFQVPKGFLAKGVELYVITGEGATCTIDIGVNSATSTHGLAIDDNLFEDAASIQTAGALLGTGDADPMGTDNKIGELFITDGNVNVLFNHATDTAVVAFWLLGQMLPTIDA
jgi:hypothetical protein